ncbi:uncharacterized protein VTP21DRAFT_10622 [Calcarisporiella thermophila]|uniref:uncharacterized protein n=1 Tax=Calcarisporiella thermophila TaxID=911321 RepID=UPI00374469C8
MTNSFSLPIIKRVGVIGAGAAGIIAAKNLSQHGFEVKIFERNDTFGGTWIYTDRVGSAPPIPCTHQKVADPPLVPEASSPVHPSAIYKNLHTNLPHPIMSFYKSPFPEDLTLFPHHSDVLEYLVSYAHENNLAQLVEFDCEVIDATDRLEDGESGWMLTIFKRRDGSIRKERFDAVVVATGHFYAPYIPEVEGLTEFAQQRKVMHSKDYRLPDEFVDKTVLVVGGGFSGVDIAKEISEYARVVWQSIRTPFASGSSGDNPTLFGDRVTIKPTVQRYNFEAGSVEFVDGSIMEGVDCVIYATGYLYTLPFLKHLIADSADVETDTKQCIPPPVPTKHGRPLLLTDGQRVHSLFFHLFYIDNPTLALVGIPFKVVPFPFFEYQSLLIARIYSGKAKLPTRETMWQEYLENEKKPVANRKAYHLFGAEKELEYKNAIANWINKYSGPNDRVEYVEEWRVQMRKEVGFLKEKFLKSDRN